MPKLAEMEGTKEYDFKPRPSSAGPDRCIRSMVYHGLKIPRNPFPGRAVLILNDSSWHEELTADWLRKSTFQLHSEQMEVKCRPPMRYGHIDGILTDFFKVDRLWEHKAINHFTFQRYWGGEFPMDYLTQTAIYTAGIQRESNPDLKEAILLIKNKNTAQYLEFLCRYKPDTLTIISKTLSTGETEKLNFIIPNIVSEACEKFNKTLGYIEKKTLPKRPYDIDDWHCEYCGWGETCWKNYEKEFELLQTDQMLSNEVGDMVRYRKETSAHRLEMQKEEDELKNKIIKLMENNNIRSGRTNEYILELKLAEKKNLDKSLIPSNLLKEATRISHYVKLNIKKIKRKDQNASV